MLYPRDVLPEQLLNIDKHFFVFIFHVLAYLIDIRIIELNDQKSNFILPEQSIASISFFRMAGS